MIPMLPLKLIDFVESPVPILAGLPLDGSSSGKGLDVPSLLSRCRCEPSSPCSQRNTIQYNANHVNLTRYINGL